MKLKATVDRFENEKAVLLVGENEDEYVVPRTSLPQGVVQGLWLLVEVKEHRVVKVIIDEKEIARVTRIMNQKIARFKRSTRRQ